MTPSRSHEMLAAISLLYRTQLMLFSCPVRIHSGWSTVHLCRLGVPNRDQMYNWLFSAPERTIWSSIPIKQQASVPARMKSGATSTISFMLPLVGCCRVGRSQTTKSGSAPEQSKRVPKRLNWKLKFPVPLGNEYMGLWNVWNKHLYKKNI